MRYSCVEGKALGFDWLTFHFSSQSVSGCEKENIQATHECLHQLTAEDIIRASPLDVTPYWEKAQIMDLPTPDEQRGALAIVDGKNAQRNSKIVVFQ